MKKDIIIRKYKVEDKEQVIDLLNRNFQDQEHMKWNRDISWWNWKYEKNIFGKPIIYVAVYKGKIIGVRPFWPWQLTINNEIVNCYLPIDTVVDMEFRGHGIFTSLTKKALQEVDKVADIIFNFPNNQSIKGNLNLGWSFVSELNWFVKINKSLSFLRLYKNNQRFKNLPLRPEDTITKEKIFNINNYLLSANPNLLSTNKTCEYFCWRFLEHPKISYGLNVIEKNNKKLFYIFEINQNNYGKELIVLDYIGDFELLGKFINEISKISKKYDVTYTLILKKNNVKTSEFIRKLYIPQKRKNFVVLPIKDVYKDLALTYKNWDLCLGMHDSV